MKGYITVQDAAKKWNITIRRVQALCAEGRIKGATKHASVWAIPENVEKPSDARIISGKYKKE
ncbi:MULTISPECIES: DNA-binding protein [Clostridia]|uniref:DNA-binding protein n=1 Tax=Clostridia TaxID=186801 RepID=UPI00177F13C1|nr:DNA-binding protein [Thermoanaerobacterium thermosaccharolyticum]MBE0068264.1 helix-turn-helix domain-containing protein [Thermoanaerobacterium thermosaccharolyticum]MBE0228159.1 helix-turn-helix domain-containing protein [Thermoanaerobacterium thermosaccharolyticum]